MAESSSNIKVAFHQIHDETTKSIVMTITMPGGSGVKKTVRVPKALCRNWTNTHVSIFSGYFSRGVTEVNLLRRATANEFDEPTEHEQLRMPLKHSVEHKQWITDEVMTAYSGYEKQVRG